MMKKLGGVSSLVSKAGKGFEWISRSLPNNLALVKEKSGYAKLEKRAKEIIARSERKARAKLISHRATEQIQSVAKQVNVNPVPRQINKKDFAKKAINNNQKPIQSQAVTKRLANDNRGPNRTPPRGRTR
jgi:hypothetical protein